MIFGFNTDVKYGETVYHIQSEARTNDLLLQTQVFVKGHCLGKHATSYAEEASKPGFSEEQMHELLKVQHKSFVEAVRGGHVEELFTQNAADVQNVGGRGLSLRWENSDSVYQEGSVVMRFVVNDGGRPVPGAKLTTRLAIPQDAPIYSTATTDPTGVAELKIFMDESVLAESALLVQAIYEDKSVTRKFRLKKA
jgi:hypothetical protein